MIDKLPKPAFAELSKQSTTNEIISNLSIRQQRLNAFRSHIWHTVGANYKSMHKKQCQTFEKYFASKGNHGALDLQLYS